MPQRPDGDAICRIAPGPARRPDQGGRLGTGRRSGQAGGEPLDPPHPGPARADATHRCPVGCPDPVAHRMGEDGSPLDRSCGGLSGVSRRFRPGSSQAQPLGLATDPVCPATCGSRHQLAASSYGPIHSGQTGAGGVGTGAGGGPVHADPAPFLRSAGTATPPRRGPGLRRRFLAAGLRKPGGRLHGLGLTSANNGPATGWT